MDNGRFWFDHVRIPRTNLLDRYGSVSKDGTYSSMIANNDARFAITMGTFAFPFMDTRKSHSPSNLFYPGNLLTGRVSISRGSTNVCKVALTTAIRYAFTRRQFGPPGKETPIINYLTHQVRLIPLLATTYAHHFISRKATNDFVEAQAAMDLDAIKNVHVLVSGIFLFSFFFFSCLSFPSIMSLDLFIFAQYTLRIESTDHMASG